MNCDVKSLPSDTHLLKFNNTRHTILPQTRVKCIAKYNYEYKIHVTQDFTIYNIKYKV
jgi:hypothetical protein